MIRLAGPEAFLIADRVTRSKRSLTHQPGQTLRRVTVYDPKTQEALDDGLAAIFHAPRSFTGEDVVEFQVHGGTVLLARVLAAILSAGARMARPGEFSERA